MEVNENINSITSHFIEKIIHQKATDRNDPSFILVAKKIESNCREFITENTLLFKRSQ